MMVRKYGDKMKFRWLGVAGVEIETAGQILLVDPYLSRVNLRRVLLGSVQSDSELVSTTIKHCDYVLITHSHYDHLMDVPEVISRTGAQAFGSKNSCQILGLHGIPAESICEVSIGDRLVLGAYQVEVLSSEHIPTLGLASGSLQPDLDLPLRARDYRMDECFGFLITVVGKRVLVRPGETVDGAVPADLLCVSPHRRPEYYEERLGLVEPRVVVPIHWDNFFRPLSRPLRPILKPPGSGGMGLGRINLDSFVRIVNRAAPEARVLLPEILHSYDMSAWLVSEGSH